MREMTSFFFNDQGHAVPYNVARKTFRATTTDCDFARFMVVNAGWVHVAFGFSSFKIKLRPAKVNQRALAATLFCVAEFANAEINLTVYTGHEVCLVMYGSRGSAINAICAVMNEVDVVRSKPFARRAVARGQLANKQTFEALLSTWAELQGIFDFERLWRLLNVGLAGRYLVFRAHSDGLRLESMGAGFQELANYWSGARHPRVVDQPDAAYGQWIARTYEDVCNRMTPLVDQVDCEVAWPSEGSRRHRYWRCVAPFRRPNDGQTLLLSVTMHDSMITLR